MAWTFKDSNNRKIVEGYLSTNLVKEIYKLMDRKVFDDVVGLINEGKESTVLLVASKEKRLALKIHKVETSKFQKMQQYILGDPRFTGIKRTRRSFVHAWAKKEFSNLQRAKRAGVRCPEAYAFYNTLVVLDFIGIDNLPAPKLKDVTINDAALLFDQIIEDYKKLYGEARLVHGDLSEYNILISGGNPTIIDFAQSVLLDHPRAEEFFMRDIENLCNYFKKLGVKRDVQKTIELIRGKR